MLYCEEVGLVVFEVKDWVLGQIEEGSPHQFLIQIKGKTESRKNPFQQAHDYLVSIKDRIQKDGHLVSKEPTYFGTWIWGQA